MEMQDFVSLLIAGRRYGPLLPEGCPLRLAAEKPEKRRVESKHTSARDWLGVFFSRPPPGH